MAGRGACAAVRRKRPLIGFLGGASFEQCAALRSVLGSKGCASLGTLPVSQSISNLRFAEGDYQRLPELARELAKLKPDLILAAVTRGAAAAHRGGSSHSGRMPIALGN